MKLSSSRGALHADIEFRQILTPKRTPLLAASRRISSSIWRISPASPVSSATRPSVAGAGQRGVRRVAHAVGPARAEAGLFDSIFLADQLALGDDVDQAARTWLEPVTVLAAVAVATGGSG
jgi:hypothetical protein